MKILLPLSWIYGGVMAFRNWMFDHGQLSQTAFAVPVISIGNLAVGGTGKTPHTEYLLRQLLQEGRKCAVLSRGYGRKTQGFYKAEGHGPLEVGDEPWQVQSKFPAAKVYVCEKRVVGIQRILQEKEQPDVVLLDDAYQHRYVKPGLSILLTDYSRPYYDDDVMPAGRLREFRSGARRANLIVVTKCPPQLSQVEQEKMIRRLAPLPHQQVFFTYFAYGDRYPYQPDDKATGKGVSLGQEKILVLCGIARPKPLLDYLRPQCGELALEAFPDHHRFSAAEIARLGKLASRYDKVITTEKDAARLSSYTLPQELQQRLWVQPVTVHFINQASDKFNKIISNYVTENSRNRTVD